MVSIFTIAHSCETFRRHQKTTAATHMLRKHKQTKWLLESPSHRMNQRQQEAGIQLSKGSPADQELRYNNTATKWRLPRGGQQQHSHTSHSCTSYCWQTAIFIFIPSILHHLWLKSRNVFAPCFSFCMLQEKMCFLVHLSVELSVGPSFWQL